MATINYLGPYQLRNWIGPCPQRIQQQVEVLASPGVNYEAVRLIGARGNVTVRESVVDVANVVFGRLLFTQYSSMIGATPAKLIWNNYDFDNENIRAAVLGCELIDLSRRALICNPLVFGNTWDLRVRWSFLLVPTGGI